ncbi:MAG: hypothetical protein Q8P67_18290 [archaeon]|nr:hypothetical protein [archaeon]
MLFQSQALRARSGPLGLCRMSADAAVPPSTPAHNPQATSGEEWEKARSTNFTWKIIFAGVVISTSLIEAQLFLDQPATFLHLGESDEDNDKVRALIKGVADKVQRIFF